MEPGVRDWLQHHDPVWAQELRGATFNRDGTCAGNHVELEDDDDGDVDDKFIEDLDGAEI